MPHSQKMGLFVKLGCYDKHATLHLAVCYNVLIKTNYNAAFSRNHPSTERHYGSAHLISEIIKHVTNSSALDLVRLVHLQEM